MLAPNTTPAPASPPGFTGRRGFLSALALVPIVAAGASISATTASSPSRALWDAAMAQWEAAAKVSAHYDAAAGNLAWQGFQAEFPSEDWSNPLYRAARDAIEPVMERQDDLSNAAWDAERTLLRVPAPDLPALLFKLEHYFGEDVREDGNCQPWTGYALDNFMNDARRLLSGGEG
jgi:hypothetical protein